MRLDELKEHIDRQLRIYHQILDGYTDIGSDKYKIYATMTNDYGVFLQYLNDLKEEKDKEMVRIKIKYFDEDDTRLEYIDGKSDWIDLRAAEDVLIQKGDFKLIPLGVAMELPNGFEAHVVPRSSTFKNYGIIQTNSFGVIDNSYCGDNDQWHFPAYATRDTHIHKGDRICQFRIMRNQPEITFDEVEHLKGKNRGGFGSTGVK